MVALRIAAVTGAIILSTLLPFLPGRYDPLAVPLSMLAQLFGKVGLLLVPAGVLWMAAGRAAATPRRRSVVAVTALAAFLVVWAILSLGAFVESVVLGLAMLAVGAYAIVRIRRASRMAAASALPLSFIFVPAAVALIQLALARPVPELSRSHAIRNSAPLIADIERYRVRNGHYPRSLVSVNRDYSPSVIGIEEYRYEPSGDAYNVFFEQLTFRLGTREIVMYNPRDRQVMTSHALDVLQLTPEQLALDQARGHNAVHDAPEPHWKYFWFD